MAHRFIVECMTTKASRDVIKEIDNAGHDVCHAEMDQTFSNQLNIIVGCKGDDPKPVREMLWAKNGGLSCEYKSITSDELEQYL